MTTINVVLGIIAIVGWALFVFLTNKLSANAEQRANALSRADEAERENNTLRESLANRDEELKAVRTQLSDAQQKEARLSERVDQQTSQFEDAQKRSQETFGSLAAEALASSNKQFLDLAKQTFESHKKDAATHLDEKSKAFADLIKPIDESLKKANEKIEAFDKNRISSHASLTKHLDVLLNNTDSLKLETGRLVQSLKAPHVRGRWGEMALRNTVELAGMTEHCDFSTQESVTGDEGNALRPDMTIRLPEGRCIVVDAKAPLHAYIESIEAETDERRADRLKAHARQLRSRIDDLASKGYQSQFDETPDFVVLFVPGDQFLSAGFREDPDLLEYATIKGVILTTPATLIALLKAVSFGWSQASLADDARDILELGRTIHLRISTLTEGLKTLGSRLDSTVKAYNESVGTAEGSLLPAARRLEERNAKSKKQIKEFKPVLTQPRHTAPQLDSPDSNPDA